MYKSTNAKRILLQMPLATLSVGKSGSHQVYLVDEGVNLTLAWQALESYHQKSTCPLTPDTRELSRKRKSKVRSYHVF